ncbi:MAG: 3-dehydroquinate synthase [Nitrospiria bacterium]
MGMMEAIHVDLGKRAYDIIHGGEILSLLGTTLRGLGVSGKLAVLTNPKIDRLHGMCLRDSLKEAGYRPMMIRIPAGERHKTLEQINRVYDRLISRNFERGDTLLAFGGGVIGDMCGFAAATFLRGIAYVQIPTTVVAQVDASIGGKTGVDHPRGKNLIGAFHQPRLVYIDPGVLNTLNKREFKAGLAEIVKYGMISDTHFFAYLEKNSTAILSRNPEKLAYCIQRSAEMKASIVEADEQESGLRKILNYGHTFGHAVETLTGYQRYKHGEAVSIGMIFAARMAFAMGLIDATQVNRQTTLLKSLGLPTTIPKLDLQKVLKVMLSDKKVVGGEIYFVLPEKIGSVKVMPVSRKILKNLLQRTLNLT